MLDVQPEQLLQDGGSAQGGNVALASGQLLPYDWLVVSLGAAADPRGVPGVREYATPFITLEDAEFVAGRLAAFEARAAVGQPQATVVVVGAGYAGADVGPIGGCCLGCLIAPCTTHSCMLAAAIILVAFAACVSAAQLVAFDLAVHRQCCLQRLQVIWCTTGL